MAHRVDHTVPNRPATPTPTSPPHWHDSETESVQHESGLVTHGGRRLPAIPISPQGDFDPIQLPVVLSPPFYTPFTFVSWGSRAATILQLASEHFLDVYLSWGISPQPNAPQPSAEQPPTIHDVLEALYVLNAQRLSPATVSTHAQLQATLNGLRLSSDENRRMHQLHERYPLLTMRAVIQLSTRKVGTARSAIIAGAVGRVQLTEKVGNDELPLSPTTHSTVIDVQAKAAEQMKRLDQLEGKAISKKEGATKKHVLASSVISLLATIATFLVLYEMKRNNLGGQGE